MISSGLQLYSWFVSVLIGFIYASFLNLFIRYNKRKSIPLMIIKSAIFIITCVVLLIFIYYKCNNGYIHYSFLIFWIIGFYLFLVVKSYVKRHKK